MNDVEVGAISLEPRGELWKPFSQDRLASDRLDRRTGPFVFIGDFAKHSSAVGFVGGQISVLCSNAHVSLKKGFFDLVHDQLKQGRTCKHVAQQVLSRIAAHFCKRFTRGAKSIPSCQQMTVLGPRKNPRDRT